MEHDDREVEKLLQEERQQQMADRVTVIGRALPMMTPKECELTKKLALAFNNWENIVRKI